MSITIVIVHTGYALMLLALVARDVLWLRALLIGAQALIATYAWLAGVPAISAWNVLFVVLNTAWVVRIVRERRAVSLPAGLRALHERHFAALTQPEFLRWWKQGRREAFENVRLAREGDAPDSLYFLLSGVVRISRHGVRVVDLTAGHFVAEMSLLTGETANADADALGVVEVIRWQIDDLKVIRDRDPRYWTKIQSVIGHDLVEKIRRGGH